MAICINDILADAILQLCAEKKMKNITVKDLMEKTGISRQTFYNHFKDKQDLIQWVYLNRVLKSFLETNLSKDYYSNTLDYYYRIAAHHIFLKSACMMSGQNCLREFIIEFAINYDLNWHKLHLNNNLLPEKLRFASRYHSLASINLAIEWILTDMPIAPIEMAKQITQLREIGLSEMLYEFGVERNLYTLKG